MKMTKAQIISRFECKGWGLYLSTKPVDTMDGIKRVIEVGRTTDMVEGASYVPLPLIDRDNDYDAMMQTMEHLKSPCGYVDLVTVTVNEPVVDLAELAQQGIMHKDGKFWRAAAVYRIDSVVHDHDGMVLVTDLYRGVKPPAPNIVILEEAINRSIDNCVNPCRMRYEVSVQ